MGSNDVPVKLDLNNPVFQKSFFDLEKVEFTAARNTFKKLLQMTWTQVYQDQGLKWEKIASVPAPQGVDSLYSLRVTQGRRAVAFREGDTMRLLYIPQDHDATYGKK